MNKIIIFYGSNREFNKKIPRDSRNLTDVVMELDSDNKNMIVHIPELQKENNETKIEKEKLKVANFVINSDELLSVKLDAPVPCRLDAPDLDFACCASADCLHQHLQVI